MNDIDYDELDRAVNSLSGSSTGPDEPSSVPVNSATTLPSTTVALPVVTPPEPSTTTSDNLQANLVARRSSGRFMDVMHPSSDMRPTQPIPPRSVTNLSAPVVPSPAPTMETNSFSSTPVIQSSSPQPVEVDSSSPFLPDTKVEKRPLGAFAGATMPQMPTAPINTSKPIDSDTPLPPELQDDLLSVETSEEEAPETQDPPVSVFNQPSAEPVQSENTQVTGSILQQYVEKAEAPAPPTASIFEVGSMKPANKKTGKKSGWLVVLWIIILIILGAGAGAAVYFYVLPKL